MISTGFGNIYIKPDVIISIKSSRIDYIPATWVHAYWVSYKSFRHLYQCENKHNADLCKHMGRMFDRNTVRSCVISPFVAMVMSSPFSPAWHNWCHLENRAQHTCKIRKNATKTKKVLVCHISLLCLRQARFHLFRLCFRRLRRREDQALVFQSQLLWHTICQWGSFWAYCFIWIIRAWQDI